jgi:hypothetical protein
MLLREQWILFASGAAVCLHITLSLKLCCIVGGVLVGSASRFSALQVQKTNCSKYKIVILDLNKRCVDIPSKVDRMIVPSELRGI